MVKEIEKYGMPVVHMSTITTISLSVGANRIVPTVAIPHPVGDPSLSEADELALRVKLVRTALMALSSDVEGPTTFDAV